MIDGEMGDVYTVCGDEVGRARGLARSLDFVVVVFILIGALIVILHDDL